MKEVLIFVACVTIVYLGVDTIVKGVSNTIDTIVNHDTKKTEKK